MDGLNTCGVELSRTVIECQDVDFFTLDPIDGAITANEDFSNVLDSEFRNNSPRSWKASQLIGGTEDTVREYRCKLC